MANDCIIIVFFVFRCNCILFFGEYYRSIILYVYFAIAIMFSIRENKHFDKNTITVNSFASKVFSVKKTLWCWDGNSMNVIHPSICYFIPRMNESVNLYKSNALYEQWVMSNIKQIKNRNAKKIHENSGNDDCEQLMQHHTFTAANLAIWYIFDKTRCHHGIVSFTLYYFITNH